MEIKHWIFFAVCACGSLTAMAQNDSLPKQIVVGKERVKARKTIRMPQIDGYNLLKCDFHIHTIFSDGIVWPSLRVAEAWEEGLDAIALTDHIEGQPARPGVQKGDHNRSFDMAQNEAQRRDIILIRGGEITRAMPPGHLNALFVTDVNELDQPDYMKAIEAAVNQGAFIEWNHPGWGVDEIKWHDVHEQLYQKGWLHGIEVFNEFEWYPVALNWVNEKKLTLISNTDVHDVNERLYDFTTTRHRPMTLVMAKNRSAEAIKEALFDRRTLAYFFGTLMGKEDYLKKFFDGAVEVSPTHYANDKHEFITLTNDSDVPFVLINAEQGKTGYPARIEIPGGQSVVVSLSKSRTMGGALYQVDNMIISPDRKLQVKLF